MKFYFLFDGLIVIQKIFFLVMSLISSKKKKNKAPFALSFVWMWTTLILFFLSTWACRN